VLWVMRENRTRQVIPAARAKAGTRVRSGARNCEMVLERECVPRGGGGVSTGRRARGGGLDFAAVTDPDSVKRRRRLTVWW